MSDGVDTNQDFKILIEPAACTFTWLNNIFIYRNTNL